MTFTRTMKVFKVRLEVQPHDPSDEDAEPWTEEKVVMATDDRSAGIKAQSEVLAFYTERDNVPYEASIVSVKERVRVREVQA